LKSLQRTFMWRLALSALVALFVLAMLVWENFNGGIKTHHILQSAAMPGISNAWNVLLLPGLTWFLSGRISRRITLHRIAHYQSAPDAITYTSNAETLPANAMLGFLGALVFGTLLSVFFALGNDEITAIIFFGILLSALVLPVYRAECVLGFVLGMTFIFGAFIPIMIGSIIAAIAAIIQRLIYPLLARVWRRIAIQ